MTVKKVAIIAAAGAVLLAGALTLSMTLITRNKIEVTATETSAQNETEQEESGVKTLENMENMPLYFEDTEKLLLPLRNTMEALGGTVKWDTEKKQTAISYRGRTLRVRSGERDAVLNGYAVTLPEEPNMINGCLYVDEEVISAYYTGEVRFNHETKQVTLEMKDGTEPVVAVKELTADEENGGYSVDVPVIVGLNDANYEKSLNDSLMQQMQDYITAFMAEENTADSLLQVQVTTGFCTKDFLSILWEGTRNGMPVRFAKNLDLLGQRAVTLADMLTQTSLEAAQAQAGEDCTAEQFYLTADGELILIERNAEGGQTIEVHLMPEEAYGQADPDAIFTVELAQLPGAEELEAGQQVYLQNAAGQPFPVKVVSKDDTTITFDANHEMAGKELNFKIELVEVK